MDLPPLSGIKPGIVDGDDSYFFDPNNHPSTDFPFIEMGKEGSRYTVGPHKGFMRNVVQGVYVVDNYIGLEYTESNPPSNKVSITPVIYDVGAQALYEKLKKYRLFRDFNESSLFHKYCNNNLKIVLPMGKRMAILVSGYPVYIIPNGEIVESASLIIIDGAQLSKVHIISKMAEGYTGGCIMTVPLL